VSFAESVVLCVASLGYQVRVISQSRRRSIGRSVFSGLLRLAWDIGDCRRCGSTTGHFALIIERKLKRESSAVLREARQAIAQPLAVAAMLLCRDAEATDQ
jgi:hypothetical protein